MILRTFLFRVLFLLVTLGLGLPALLLLVLPYRVLSGVAYLWCWLFIFLLERIVGISYRIEGSRPQHQVIYASKHQSAWETLAFYKELGAPILVLKRVLIFIPIVGQIMMRLQSIAIDRSAGVKSLRKLLKSAERASRLGRDILIYPQGTRVFPQEERPYHGGTFAIYQATGLPVVPIAHNSGVFWPTKLGVFWPFWRGLRKSGVIEVRFLEEIPAGLDRQNFMARLENVIESGTNALPQS